MSIVTGLIFFKNVHFITLEDCIFSIYGVVGRIWRHHTEVGKRWKARRNKCGNASTWGSVQCPLPGDRPLQLTLCPVGPDPPVQMEGCDLSIVSLKVNEIEEICGRLLVSLLSGKKEGVTPWTETSAVSLRRELQGRTSEEEKHAFMLFMCT